LNARIGQIYIQKNFLLRLSRRHLSKAPNYLSLSSQTAYVSAFFVRQHPTVLCYKVKKDNLLTPECAPSSVVS